MPRPKQKSRTQRWLDAASLAMTGLEELVSIQEEYQDWYDNLPENLQYSAVGDKLSTICDIDLSRAFDIVSEANGADLPLGFGRD